MKTERKNLTSLLGLGTLYCVKLHGKAQRHKRRAIVMLRALHIHQPMQWMLNDCLQLTLNSFKPFVNLEIVALKTKSTFPMASLDSVKMALTLMI